MTDMLYWINDVAPELDCGEDDSRAGRAIIACAAVEIYEIIVGEVFSDLIDRLGTFGVSAEAVRDGTLLVPVNQINPAVARWARGAVDVARMPVATERDAKIQRSALVHSAIIAMAQHGDETLRTGAARYLAAQHGAHHAA